MMDRQGNRSFATEARHRVDVQTVTRTRDGVGGFTQSWSTLYADVPAVIYPMAAQQVLKYQSVGVEATHWVKVRGEIAVTENHRILFGSRIFEVKTVEDMQERRDLKIVACKEVR